MIERSTLPIIVVHRGASEVARAVVAQACFFYHGDVVLMHDGVDGRERNLHCVNLAHCEDATTPFTSVYRHRSLNDESYERFCFERWFCILHYMESESLSDAIIMDSDVLVYRTIGDLIGRLAEHEFTSWTHFAHVTRARLAEFCEYVVATYETEGALDAMIRRRRPAGASNPEHVSDMDFFEEFAANNGLNMNENFLLLGVDPNVSLSHGCVMEQGIKRLMWRGGVPHVQVEATRMLIPFHAVHFQGHAKAQLPRFVARPLDAEPELLSRTMAAAAARALKTVNPEEQP